MYNTDNGRKIWWYVFAALLVALLVVGLATSSATAALPSSDSQTQATQNDERDWESLAPEEQQALFERGLPARIRPFYKTVSVASRPASSGTPAGPSQPLEECWTEAPSDNPGTGDNVLVGVSTLSETDAFAVGAYTNTTQPDIYNHMVLRFNGTNWPQVSTGIPISGSNFLQGVHANSASDVWTVGTRRPANRYESLILHYDGSTWTKMMPPHSGNGDNVLSGLDSNASNEVTAVGYKAGPSGGTQNFILHWNGSTWAEEVSPNPSGFLNFVTGVSYYPGTNNRIAVGYNLGSNPLTFRPMAMQSINGGPWALLSVPLVGSSDHFVNGVSAAGPDEAWLAGYNFVGATTQTLVYRSLSGSVSQVPSPNMPGNNNLYAIAITTTQGISGTFGMAVGAFNDGSGDRALALRYDGLVFLARQLGERFPLTHYAYDPDRARQLLDQAGWSVGAEGIRPTRRTSTTRYRNPCNPPQGTATPTSISITPTATPTAMPCTPGSFTDVPPGSTFYPFITCLANRGIVSGYADCTFRPNNEVTRGQLAKIVSNAAGFSEDPGAQIFQDVPPGSTFYDWINRLTRRGYMSGYVCGSPGEPCINNMPYFRPVANATRGQTSKIVSNTAGYTEIPTTQTFEDVLPTHTFYREIERLASRNIMGGYQCGGPGEPCVSGRAYFRPQNNVTRGQSAKIVANTFYPNCQTAAP